MYVPSSIYLSSLFFHRAQEEDEEWKKTAYFYDVYAAKECHHTEDRRHAQRNAPQTNPSSTTTIYGTGYASQTACPSQTA
jgi:hypothetical protein